MIWEIIAYAIVMVIVYLSLTSIPGMLIALLFGNGGNPYILAFFGKFISWIGISSIWHALFNSPPPILLFGLVFLFVGIIAYLQKDELTQAGNADIGAEQWAVFVLGIYFAVSSDVINWF